MLMPNDIYRDKIKNDKDKDKGLILKILYDNDINYIYIYYI